MQNVPETLYHEAKLIDKGVMPNPRMFVVHPTYTCNQRCYYCFWRDWNNKGAKEPTEKIPDMLKQLKDLDIQAVDWCGGGDPLMTPGIKDHIKLAGDLGFRQGMITNGVLFKDELAEEYLKRGTYVRFSLDTVNPEIYKKIHGTDHCLQVLENIKNALRIREDLKSLCQISIKIGIAREIGTREISDVYYHFDGSKLDNIQIKNLEMTSGKHYREDINRVELYKLEDNQTIPVIKKVVYPKYMNEQCWISPTQGMIDVFGDVYICCYYIYRKESHKIGNIYETPLKDIWGSPRHRKVIDNLKITECLRHDCRFQKYMRAIRKAQQRGDWEFL